MHIEITNRANQFQSELLARYCVPDIANLSERQLEAFRAQSGLHVNDPSWLVVVDRWTAARETGVW